MKYILYLICTIVNSYILPKHKYLLFMKNKNLKKNIKKLDKNIPESEYFTEWDFYNQTWKN